MSIETLYAQNPTVINAVFDKIWVEEIVISAPELNSDAQARVRLRKFRTTESGGEFSPEQAETITVDSIISGSRSDQDLANAILYLMNYIAKKGIESGIIAQS